MTNRSIKHVHFFFLWRPLFFPFRPSIFVLRCRRRCYSSPSGWFRDIFAWSGSGWMIGFRYSGYQHKLAVKFHLCFRHPSLSPIIAIHLHNPTSAYWNIAPDPPFSIIQLARPTKQKFIFFPFCRHACAERRTGGFLFRFAMLLCINLSLSIIPTDRRSGSCVSPLLFLNNTFFAWGALTVASTSASVYDLRRFFFLTHLSSAISSSINHSSSALTTNAHAGPTFLFPSKASPD